MSIDASLIGSIGSQLQGVQLSQARTQEIASEIEVLFAGLEDVLPTIDFFDDPDSFRAALWELRDADAKAGRDA